MKMKLAAILFLISSFFKVNAYSLPKGESYSSKKIGQKLYEMAYKGDSAPLSVCVMDMEKLIVKNNVNFPKHSLSRAVGTSEKNGAIFFPGDQGERPGFFIEIGGEKHFVPEPKKDEGKYFTVTIDQKVFGLKFVGGDAQFGALEAFSDGNGQFTKAKSIKAVPAEKEQYLSVLLEHSKNQFKKMPKIHRNRSNSRAEKGATWDYLGLKEYQVMLGCQKAIVAIDSSFKKSGEFHISKIIDIVDPKRPVPAGTSDKQTAQGQSAAK